MAKSIRFATIDLSRIISFAVSTTNDWIWTVIGIFYVSFFFYLWDMITWLFLDRNMLVKKSICSLYMFDSSGWFYEEKFISTIYSYISEFKRRNFVCSKSIQDEFWNTCDDGHYIDHDDDIYPLWLFTRNKIDNSLFQDRCMSPLHDQFFVHSLPIGQLTKHAVQLAWYVFLWKNLSNHCHIYSRWDMLNGNNFRPILSLPIIFDSTYTILLDLFAQYCNFDIC